MKKENFFGLAIVLLLALHTPLPAQAFRFAAEEEAADGAESDVVETETKAVEPPVAFGEKETESAVGLHPTTYNADETSSREDRQLGKKGVRGILGRIVSLIFFFTQQRANVVESRETLFQIDKLIENFYINSAEGLIH